MANLAPGDVSPQVPLNQDRRAVLLLRSFLVHHSLVPLFGYDCNGPVLLLSDLLEPFPPQMDSVLALDLDRHSVLLSCYFLVVDFFLDVDDVDLEDVVVVNHSVSCHAFAVGREVLHFFDQRSPFVGLLDKEHVLVEFVVHLRQRLLQILKRVLLPS